MPQAPTEAADPAAVVSCLERGRALRKGNRPEEALAEFRAALEIAPGIAEAHFELGNALKSLRRYGEAAASLRAAAALAPGSGAVWLNLGVACLELGRTGEAVAAFERAIALEPGRPEAHNILGHALLVQGRCVEAERRLGEALRLRPGYAAAQDNLGRVMKAQGRSAEAVAFHRAALETQPKPETHSNLLYSLNFPEGLGADEILSEHRRWAEVHARPLRSAWRAHTNILDPARRLRIGYVSADLVNHAVAYFLEPALSARDWARFEVTCYSDARVTDAMTDRLRGWSDRWRDIAGLADSEVAERIRQDGIDILVDLGGHTARNRLLVFARRPAPLQLTWLGYPNTTGLDSIDYRLTDAVADPAGVSEARHTEELWRLPESFLCYGAAAESPPVAEPPAAAAGRTTYGCFNHVAKLTPAVTDLWAELLVSDPSSRLLLRSPGLSDPETGSLLRARFAARGIAPGRIELDGERLPLAAHLGRYAAVDVALDPFPYNGTTTTCEALWMGVPVVTLAGASHRARVGASLLTHLGAPEWIAGSPADYVARARRLGADGLAGLRRGLRERMRCSPLCDARRFTRGLEAAFRSMWERRCAGA